ncbi:hypothetical protein BGZ46_008242 [Entomortierella lignicola]|nr:hypothetical protein BGZ46_008242 [Entomortierella lignicola]
MHTVTLQQEPRPEKIDIGDGLIMRWSTPQDKDNLVDCLADAFRWDMQSRRIPEDGVPNKNECIIAGVGRLMSGKHVVQSQYDIALVEDTKRSADQTLNKKNPIVAAICMHQMAGYYGSIEVTYGALGAVGSLPEYRNRGLVKKLFLEMMHPAANARGDLMTFILGIPHFYRQFGYEYAVPHKFGRVLKDLPSVFPALSSKQEPVRLREASVTDIPYLVKMSTPDRIQCNAQLGIYYGQDFWTYIVAVLNSDLESIENHHDAHHHPGIIVDEETGKDVGIILTSNVAGRWVLEAFVIGQDANSDDDLLVYRNVAPSILRQLKAFDRPYYECYNKKLNNNVLPDESETMKRERGEYSPLAFTDLGINLTQHHALTKMLDSQEKLAPENPPFRLYTRIPSLPKWIQKIAPVLEERLKESQVFKGISAKIQIDFFRRLEGMSGRGLEITFFKGKFVKAQDWTLKSPEQIHQESIARKELPNKDRLQKENEEEMTVFSAGFAPLTFTRLVTGTMDVSELLQRDSENYIKGEEAKLMLEILFPKFDHFVDLFWW